MSRLLDTIRQPTKWIEPIVAAQVEQAVKPAIVNPTPETPAPVDNAARQKQIELATEINANIYAVIAETPFDIYNTVVNGRLAKKKARKTITDPDKLEKRLQQIDNLVEENKDYIRCDDAEFDRFKRIARLKAEKDGGKVNENGDLIAAFLGLALKRSVVFVSEW